MELFFGWRTAVLLCAVLVTLPICIGLLHTAANRTASRTLAFLLLALAGVVTPWMIGFAGFYDRWPWLTFLPVAMPLLVPPLAWAYGHALTHDCWPSRAKVALMPALLHFALMTAAFCLPLPLKERVADAVAGWLDAVVAALLIASFCVAIVLLRRDFETYTRWLVEQRSDDARYATRWLARTLTILALLFAGWAIFEITDLVHPLGYEGLMPLYCGIAAAMVFLAIEGWRHAALPWPVMTDAEPEAAPPGPAGHDWTALGQEWQRRLREEEHYRESDLSLARTARLLGTNTSYLSRACNEGLGMSFSSMVNRMRAEAVAEAIAANPTAGLLDLALAAGFASKASFNRAFADRFGTNPSAWRRRLRS